MFRVESDLPRKPTGRANSKTFLAQGAQANSQATRSPAKPSRLSRVAGRRVARPGQPGGRTTQRVQPRGCADVMAERSRFWLTCV